ncbi:MAG: HIT family protein [Planctomycetota bacterium]
MPTNYPTDPDCIFCKIVAGDIPCHNLYEDDLVLAMLDIGPIAPGHTLLIPKGHYPALADVPPDTAAALGRVMPQLGAAVCKATHTDNFNVLQNNGRPAGQAVFHVHFHLIPRTADDARTTPPPGSPGTGLSFDWPATELDPDAATTLANRIRSAL